MGKVLIIGEAGVNHNGDINLAKKMIDAAVDADVDYVKFQTFKTDHSITRKAKKANYQILNTFDNIESQFDMVKKLELSPQNHIELIEYCNLKKIKFSSTAFDIESVKYLNDLGLDFFKIPSGEITNYPYLKAIAACKKPVILSTGMCYEFEIRAAIDLLIKYGLNKNQISILHCNTEYPTPMEDVNLRAMLTIKDKFNLTIGYSDHTLGVEVPIAAVALGAQIIEKHFTLDRSLPGPDHLASLEPQELKQMVIAIRNIEKALSGNGVKAPSESEKKNIEIARKSIVAKTKISKGVVFSELNITTKRPGYGISPMLWNEVIGKIAIKDFKEDDLIHF